MKNRKRRSVKTTPTSCTWCGKPIALNALRAPHHMYTDGSGEQIECPNSGLHVTGFHIQVKRL